jgi:6-phosphofructokinase 1
VCADALEALALDGLVVIGGNGSAMGAAALADRIPVAFVPATIDRDISGTDVTVGMDSAVGYAVDTIDRLRVTGRSLRGRAFLVQTLGAPNGFLADAVASAAGIDHVLVPEREHDLDEIAVALRELALEGSAIAVMSEAIGDAVRVSEELAQRAGIRVHPTILGHAQRAATPSAQDRTLGQAAGRAAVDALAQGRSSFIALSAAGAVRSADLVAGIGPATPSITPETKERSHEPRL